MTCSVVATIHRVSVESSIPINVYRRGGGGVGLPISPTRPREVYCKHFIFWSTRTHWRRVLSLKNAPIHNPRYAYNADSHYVSKNPLAALMWKQMMRRSNNPEPGSRKKGKKEKNSRQRYYNSLDFTSRPRYPESPILVFWEKGVPLC